MCRPKELGGRRCPQHTDPVKHAAYNSRRRELYREHKAMETEPLSSFLPPLESVRSLKVEDRKLFVEEAKAFSALVIPEYETEGWRPAPHYDDMSMQEFIDSKEALPYYTELGYHDIAGHLNGFRPSGYDEESRKVRFTARQKAWFDDLVQKIDSKLELAPKPVNPRVLYRGMKVPFTVPNSEVKKYLEENFAAGSVISQKHYMSTTLDPATAYRNFSTVYTSKTHGRSVIFEIASKKGAPLGEGTSTMELIESEYLIPREAKFEVVSVHDNADFKFSDKLGSTYKGTRTVIRLVDAD